MGSHCVPRPLAALMLCIVLLSGISKCALSATTDRKKQHQLKQNLKNHVRRNSKYEYSHKLRQTQAYPLKYGCNEVIATIHPSEVSTILRSFFTNIFKSPQTVYYFMNIFSNRVRYGVQVKTVCAACDTIKTSWKDMMNADYERYCGKDAYGYDSQQSGVVMVPLVVDGYDSTNLSELGGTLAAFIYNRSTVTNRYDVPSQAWSTTDDDHNSVELLACFLATTTSGKVSIAPDFMGYGLSDSPKGYVLRNTYVTSMLPLWKKIGSDISSNSDCKTVVADAAFIGGFSEGGFGAAAIAEGLHRALGIDIVQVKAGGAPLNPAITFMEMIKKFQRGDDLSRYWYIAVIVGNTYSSASPSAVNYNTGGQNILKDEYLYTRDWLDESGITRFEINDRISAILTQKGFDGKDYLTELWNPNFITFMEGAIDAGVDNPCDPSYSGYKVGVNDKYCEIIIQNSLIDVVQNVEYPVDLCHSRDDELVSYKNVPDVSLNPDYLSVTEASGSHSQAAGFCYNIILANFMSPEFSGYVPNSKHSDVGCSSLTPSQLPSVFPSSAPSYEPSTLPTVSSAPSLSELPTSQPSSICNASVFEGIETSIIVDSYCYRIQFYDGGKISLDPSSNDCKNTSFSLSSFSEFDSFSGADAIFNTGQLGWSGVITAVYTPGSNYEHEALVIGPITDKKFQVNFFVPYCE